MHEISIASSILEAAASEAAKRAHVRVLRIGLRIGKLAAVDGDALRFCFQALASGTEFAATDLAIESAAADELDLAFLELEEADGASDD